MLVASYAIFASAQPLGCPGVSWLLPKPYWARFTLLGQLEDYWGVFMSPGIKFSQYPLYINVWSPGVLNPAHKQPILAMFIPLQSPIGCDPLGPLLLPPGFEAMSKKAQQLWKTCQRLEQQAYPVEICSPC